MTPADLSRLSTLLDEALELPLPDREAWLAALDGEAAALVPTLRKLLARAAAKDTDDLLERGPAFELPSTGPQPGDAVGPYRLLRELGTGGMGAVWLAERTDGSLNRKVALKLPHLGWTPGLAERFARERAILATLEHPQIARLYDAGVDAIGRPYMALEYVEGEPIDLHCRERALDLGARLRLLLQVADAVAFAHSRLVLHRDLKPGNILVTPDGQVRLLDFGIAKLMEDGHAAETALTQAAGRTLTLDYASPEQIRGEPIGTASDVYSLAVVAYELLTEERPYRLRRGSAAELEQAITAQEVPVASSLAPTPERRRQLRGDLDAILGKALQKSPGERYATVDALAQDITRHLQGLSVSARRDNAAARLWRQARRHQRVLAAVTLATAAFALAVGVGATAVVILALLVGLGGALWQARRAVAERDRAFQLAERNAAGNAFIETLLTRAARGGAFTAMQLIERGEQLMSSDASAQPEHRAFVLNLIADLYAQLDQHARAVPLLDRALEAARRGHDPALRDSIMSRRALAIGWLGRADEAVVALDGLLARSDLGTEVRCEAHLHRAKLAQATGDFPATLQHASEALRWYRAAPHMPRRHEPVLLGELGWAALKNGHGDEAERYYAAAAAAFSAHGLADSAPALQYGGRRALMYQELGDLRRSIELYDELIAGSLRAMPDVPPSVYLQANRGYALAHAGRFADALADYRASAEVARSQGLWLVHYNVQLLVVELEAMRGRPDAARRELEAAEAARVVEAPQGGPAEFARQQAEAWIALAEGTPGLAVAVFGESLANRHVSAGTANALLGRAMAFARAGDWAASDADACEALEVAEALRGQRPSSSRTGLAWLARARVHAARAESGEARRCSHAALKHLQAQLFAGHPALTEALTLAGR